VRIWKLVQPVGRWHLTEKLKLWYWTKWHWSKFSSCILQFFSW